MSDIIVKKKKSGLTEIFDEKKIWRAIRKSADRVFMDLTDEDCKLVTDLVRLKIQGPEISVSKLHQLVQVCLDEAGFPRVAESYRQYRNYKLTAIKMMEVTEKKIQELQKDADRSNANADSTLTSTRRILEFQEGQKEKYKRIFLTEEEREAVEDDMIYIHDLGSRLSTPFNCCLVNTARIMKGGFKLAGIDYTEPTGISSAIALLSDIIQSVAGNSYGNLYCRF